MARGESFHAFDVQAAQPDPHRFAAIRAEDVSGPVGREGDDRWRDQIDVLTRGRVEKLDSNDYTGKPGEHRELFQNLLGVIQDRPDLREGTYPVVEQTLVITDIHSRLALFQRNMSAKARGGGSGHSYMEEMSKADQTIARQMETMTESDRTIAQTYLQEQTMPANLTPVDEAFFKGHFDLADAIKRKWSLNADPSNQKDRQSYYEAAGEVLISATRREEYADAIEKFDPAKAALMREEARRVRYGDYSVLTEHPWQSPAA